MKIVVFNDAFGHTKAVLDGRMTQMRVIFPEESFKKAKKEVYDKANTLLDWQDVRKQVCEILAPEAKYQVGDVVAIAQCYNDIPIRELSASAVKKEGQEFVRDILESAGCKDKNAVCPELMPHAIKITGFSVGRIDNALEEDAYRMGIIKEKSITGTYNVFKSHKNGKEYPLWIDAYQELVEGLYGAKSWKDRNFCFIYDFELVK